MKYFYILLICLILFYVLTRFYEKYYSQENFDPSLVPVSSIITLAKVAQKIVDGNGTLTNPANLNIGTTSATGNLLVTGNTHTNGYEIVDGTLNVTGATTLSNTLGVTGDTTVGGTLGVTGATTVGGTLGVTGNTTVGGTLGVTGATTLTGATNIGATGTPGETTSLTVNGATTISGVTTFAKDTWHKSSDNKVRHYYANNSHTYIGSPDQWFFQNPSGTNVVSIDKSGNMTINGTVTGGNLTATSNVKGSLLCIGSTCINEDQLKILTGERSIALLYNTSNSKSNYAAGDDTMVGSSGHNLIGTNDKERLASLFIKLY